MPGQLYFLAGRDVYGYKVPIRVIHGRGFFRSKEAELLSCGNNGCLRYMSLYSNLPLGSTEGQWVVPPSLAGYQLSSAPIPSTWPCKRCVDTSWGGQ